MIRLLFLILCSGLAVGAQAQIAKWSLHARYDSISLDNNGIYLVGKDGKYGLADTNVDKSKLRGNEDIDRYSIILPVQYDSIAPFKNGYAVIFNKTNGQVQGFVDEKGEFTDLTEWEYNVRSGYPYFSSGYLLVEKGMECYFIDAKDVSNRLGPYISARPFFNDIAVVQYYENPDKKNGDSFWAYLNANTKEFLQLPFTPKIDKVNFLSSYSNGMSVVCYDKEFSSYNWKDSIATPFLEKREKKSVNVKATDKVVVPLLRSTLTEYEVTAKNGMFLFDQYMRLKGVELPGEEVVEYEIEKEQLRDITTQLTIFPEERGENDLCGLNYMHRAILPPQFQEIRIVKPIEAIVKKNGKFGILSIDEGGRFNITINGGNPVEFRQSVENVRFEFSMPIYIPKPDPRIATQGIECNTRGCRLEWGNIKDNSTIIAHGFYDAEGKKGCFLTLPEDLDSSKPREYSFTVKYDDLESVEVKVPVLMSYRVPYEFVYDKSETSDSLLTVYFSAKAKDNGGIPFKLSPNDISIVSNDANCIWEGIISEIADNTFSTEFTELSKVKDFSFVVKVKSKGTPESSFNLIAKSKTVKKEPEAEESKPVTIKPKPVVVKPKPQPKPQPKPKPQPDTKRRM